MRNVTCSPDEIPLTPLGFVLSTAGWTPTTLGHIKAHAGLSSQTSVILTMFFSTLIGTALLAASQVVAHGGVIGYNVRITLLVR
jgi:hypothetical protein